MGVDALSIPTSPQGQLDSTPFEQQEEERMWSFYDVTMQRQNVIWEEICLKSLPN